MSEIILPDTSIVSLTEKRAQKDEARQPIMKGRDLCTIEQAALIATGLCERTYDALNAQHAESMAKLEAMCAQRIAALEEVIEGRTLRGRWRRLVAWLRRDISVDLEAALAAFDAEAR